MNQWQVLIRNWRSHFSMQAFTVLVLSLCFSIIISFQVFVKNADTVFSRWGKNLEMTLYLNAEVDNKIDLQKKLQAKAKFQSFRWVSSKEAKEDFQIKIKEYMPELSKIEDLANPFPPRIEVRLDQFTNIAAIPELLESLSNEFLKEKEIIEVGYGKKWISEYKNLFMAIRASSFSIMIVLFLCSLLVIGNVIRISIQKNREEIEILELVGASAAAIRKPFVVNGAFLGGSAALLSLALSYGLFYLAKYSFRSHLNMMGISNEIQFLHPVMMALIVLLAIIIGALGSYLCVRKINSGWAAGEASNV